MKKKKKKENISEIVQKKELVCSPPLHPPELKNDLQAFEVCLCLAHIRPHVSKLN